MATAVIAPPKTRQTVVYPHAHWYFLAAIVLTWIGFARSYFAVIRTQSLLHHLHGAVMGGWIAVLIVQPILYQRGQLRLHGLLGRWAAFALVPAIVVVGFLMIRSMFRGTEIPPFIVDHLAFLDVNALVHIPLFVGMGIYTARNVQLHARWISSTVLVMIPPALVRALPILPVFRHNFLHNLDVGLGLMCVIFVVLMLDDWRKAGKVYAPYPVALALTVTSAVGAYHAAQWKWWHSFAAFMGKP